MSEVKAAGFTCGDTVDYEGQTYNTVQIGDQCWFSENLNVGTMVTGTTEPTNDSSIQKWCYDNDTANCDSDGGFYSWDEAMGYTTIAGTQGICAPGWHIPTDAEQNTLDQYLATGECDANRKGIYQCNPAGTALKPGGLSNFNALLAGFRFNNGSFYNKGLNAYFWSSSESISDSWLRNLYSSYSGVYRNSLPKVNGASVRCLQNYSIPNSPPNTPVINNLNDGSASTNTTPTFNFDLSDPDSADTLRYKLELDAAGGDFSSPLLSETESGIQQEHVSIAAGYKFTVALKDDGTVWSWGSNTYGQL